MMLLQPKNKMQDIYSIKLSGRKTIGGSKNAKQATRYIISCCYWALHRRAKSGGWAQIHSQLIGDYFGGNPKRWVPLRKALIGAGVIEQDLTKDGFYIVGQRAYKFRLTPAWRGYEVENVDEPDFPDHRFTKPPKEPEAATESSEAEPAVEPAGPTMIGGLTLDRELALELLELTHRARQWASNDYECFKNQIYNFSTTYRVGITDRVITDANCLPRPVRHALRLNGEETMEIDVSNCHPLLAANLIPKDSEEYSRYRSMVQSGEIYEWIMEKLPPGPTRKEIKKNLLGAFFKAGREEYPLAGVIGDLMNVEFPDFWKVVKSHPGGTARKSLAHLFQKQEAALIWRPLAAAGIPFVSLHDGVRLAIRHRWEAQGFIEANFAAIGLKVSVGEVNVLKEIETLRGFEELGVRRKPGLNTILISS